MFMAFGLANASTVTIPAGTPYNGSPYYGAVFGGAEAMNFSADMLGVLDTARASMTAYGAASAMVMKDSDGFYTQASFATPVTSLTIDSQSNWPVGVATAGGITMTTSALKSVSSGGSLTVTDLNFDLASKKVYATLIGGNGVGTLNNVYLWDIASITGPGLTIGYDSRCGFYNDCPYLAPGMTLSGLSLTTDGFNAISQALGLFNVGKAALNGVTDFGTITMGVVPEPSTPALMGLGLAGLLVARLTRSRSAGCNQAPPGSHHSGCA